MVLFMINIIPGNELVGKDLKNAAICPANKECEIVAVFRDEEMFRFDPNIVILPEDQILLLTDKSVSEAVKKKFLSRKKRRINMKEKFKQARKD